MSERPEPFTSHTCRTMTLPELESAVGWLGRSRVGEHLGLLDDDPRHARAGRRPRAPAAGVAASQPRLL